MINYYPYFNHGFDSNFDFKISCKIPLQAMYTCRPTRSSKTWPTSGFFKLLANWMAWRVPTTFVWTASLQKSHILLYYKKKRKKLPLIVNSALSSINKQYDFKGVSNSRPRCSFHNSTLYNFIYSEPWAHLGVPGSNSQVCCKSINMQKNTQKISENPTSQNHPLLYTPLYWAFR